LIPDPVFEKALESLTAAINLGTGLLHPRDKELADETLRVLRAKGHSADIANIKSWAIKNGWRPDHAANLSVLAGKVMSLKTKPNLSKFYNAEEKYRRWRS
jgi:hypothetical protein